MEAQALSRNLLGESATVTLEYLDIASIKNEVETAFNVEQHNPVAVAAAWETVMAATKRLMAARERLITAMERSIDRVDHTRQSAAEIAANLEFLNSVIIPLNDLHLWHEQPRNTFRSIQMDEYTLLGLLSPLVLGTFKTICSGFAGIQYFQMRGQPGTDGVPERAMPVFNGDDGVRNELTESNLTNSISRFIRTGYRLVRRPETLLF